MFSTYCYTDTACYWKDHREHNRKYCRLSEAHILVGGDSKYVFKKEYVNSLEGDRYYEEIK